MINTVTKLMALADEYANAVETRDVPLENAARQALQNELVRLFTPLKGQTFNTPDEAVAYLHGYAAAHDKYKIMGAGPAVVGLAIDFAEHGITGEKNEQAT